MLDPCSARVSRGDRPCRNRAIPGGTVCRYHGGGAPQVRAAAARRLAIQAAIEDAQKFGGRLDIHPADALLELVSGKAAEVAYWERRVQALNEADLTWGQTKIESGLERGEETHIVTTEARKSIILDLLHVAQRDLAAFAAAALKAGVDKALVEIAQSQAVQLVDVLRAAFADPRVTVSGEIEAVILDALRRKGLAA